MSVVLVVIDPKHKTMERYENRTCVDAVAVAGDITPEKVETFRVTPTDLIPLDAA